MTAGCQATYRNDDSPQKLKKVNFQNVDIFVSMALCNTICGKCALRQVDLESLVTNPLILVVN